MRGVIKYFGGVHPQPLCRYLEIEHSHSGGTYFQVNKHRNYNYMKKHVYAFLCLRLSIHSFKRKSHGEYFMEAFLGGGFSWPL